MVLIIYEEMFYTITEWSLNLQNRITVTEPTSWNNNNIIPYKDARSARQKLDENKYYEDSRQRVSSETVCG